MRAFTTRALALALGAALAAGAAAPSVAKKGHGHGHAGGAAVNTLPSFVRGGVTMLRYDGSGDLPGDDLLTGGLGRSGLAAPVPPPFADPLSPTPAEHRVRAIHSNYRALVDTSATGGYGTLYGPNVLADGSVTGSEGRIPGVEAIAFAGDASGRLNVTMMVQVPDSFDPANPCIVTAPSSGSRGVYGAIGTAGEWGLKNGCAVAYTDKGTGTGAHNLETDTVGLIDGTREDADIAGKDSTFTARLSDRKRAAYNAGFPNRFAFKHAHSRVNPEADWGRNVLDSIEFAFYVLNELHGESPDKGKDKNKGKKKDKGKDETRRTIVPGNTVVIASSVSNGGGASVRAAEQDRHGLIDGVAVSEPNVNPRYDRRFAIVQGDGPPLREHSKSLLDYTTVLNVYQSCASADPAAIADGFGPPPFNFAPSPAACESLRDLGLIAGDTPEELAAAAQARINDAGILEEQNVLMPSHWFFDVPQSISFTYASSYSRSGVEDNVCDYSFAATVGAPVPLAPALEAALFGTSNGIPPTAGVSLVNNRQNVENGASLPDQNLDGALCLRALATGRDAVSDRRLRGRDNALARKVRNGVRQVRASGDLNGKPAIFVTGRSDAILPPNHTSRAYFGLNQMREGSRSGLVYVEVLNAQHLDFLNGFPGFGERYVPLHHYFNQALDRMLAHLRNGTPLPPSQVVRTSPRGDLAVQLTVEDHVPDIADEALLAPTDRITFVHREVRIPE